jgi:hypothetical protein
MGNSADFESIQNQLREKEQLVAALTERLEQAAEQLDRLRRTGADKGRRPPAGGSLPAEIVDEHKSTLEDLKRVIARWEDIQAEAALGRIETQIVELRDLVVSGGAVASASANSGSSHTPATSVRERPAEPAAPRPAGKGGGNAWWEAQKAAMLGEPVPEAAPPASTPSAESNLEAAAEPTSESPGTFDLAGITIPDLPPAVNFDELSPDEVQAAIRQRDAVIVQLREPLLLLKTAGQLPAGFRSIDEVPEPLKQCIADLEQQWQAKFRQVELDLSLERARLARDQLAVRQQQEALQKQSKNGNTGKADADSGDKGDDGSSKRRWFRFMGSAGEGGQAAGADQKK